MYAFLLILLLPFSDIHRQLCVNERYEEAVKFSKFKACSKNHSFHFWQAVAYFKLGNKAEATKSLKNYLFPMYKTVLVERYQVVAEKMLEDLDNWKEGDLGDISRDMDNSARRLRNAKADNKTREIQTEIIAKLDKMIKDTEDEMNKANQSQQSSGTGSPKIGLQESKIMETPGEGKVDNKKLIQSSEVWGKMPEKEKIKAMEALGRQLPPHIREAAEGFSKKLNKGKN